MLASITPLGERGRTNRFAHTAVAYALGATLGGLAIGAAAGMVGTILSGAFTLPGAAVAGLVAAVALAAALVDMRVAGIGLPSIHRQVNEDWLTTYRGWVYGLGFGFQLGLGVVTIVTTAAVYALLADAVLTGSVIGGAVIGLVFGAGRGVAVFLGAHVQRPDQLAALHRGLVARAGTAARTTVIVELLVAAAAATAVLGAA